MIRRLWSWWASRHADARRIKVATKLSPLAASNYASDQDGFGDWYAELPVSKRIVRRTLDDEQIAARHAAPEDVKLASSLRESDRMQAIIDAM